jgi:polysaccharide chain length determinant protein (PEP-CTERM system associated)
MLPGKTFRPEDLLLILRRRFWLVMVPFAIVSAATAVYVRYLPDVYRSEATIAVEPPRVSSNIVAGALPIDIDDRLPAIRSEILSRSRLERIIQELNLYAAERRAGGIMEDIYERMKGQIVLASIRGANAIRVGFQAGDPRTAQKVADQLAALFINESSRDRQIMIDGTDQFLQTSLEEARQRLVEKETALAKYRLEHGPELPEQVPANLQAAQNTHNRIQALVIAIDRDQERLGFLERQIAEAESQVQAPDVAMAVVPGQAATAEQQLRMARAQLTELEFTRKPEHPDVLSLKRTIRDLEARLDREALESPVSTGGGRSVSPAEAARLARLRDLREQVDQIKKQTARNTSEVEKLRPVAAEYERRAQAAPARGSEMVELNRDYNTLNGTYISLLQKREASNLTASLERRQIGEQFKLLDPARVPARPTSPNRQRMNLMGMGVGLLMGLALTGLFEYRDATLKTDDEVSRVLAMPVLAVVPFMESDVERRKAFRRKIFVSTVLGSTVAGCLAVLVYTFVR